MRTASIALALLAALALAGADARGGAYTSTKSGNWSDATAWTPAPPAGGPGSGDTATIASGHTITVDSAAGPSADGVVVVGNGGPSCPPKPAFASTGGSVTSLPTGNYRCTVTQVDASGNESTPSPETGSLALTSGAGAPLVTVGALPAGVVSRRIYLTNTGAATGTERLYASGVTASTYSPASASWTDGGTTFAAAAAMPASSAIGMAFNAASAPSLTIAAGCALTCRGDVAPRAAFGVTATLTLQAGAGLTLKPASGQQYQLKCEDIASIGWNAVIAINGTSGARCTVATDTSLGGSSSYVSYSTGPTHTHGLTTAAYCDFSNWGDATNPGLATHVENTTAASITNCTFANCSYIGSYGVNTAWDGNLAFQYNVFSSSRSTSINGNAACAGFTFNANPTTGARLVDSNAFDLAVSNGAFKRCRFTNNVVRGNWTGTSGSSWPDGTYFSGNVVANSAPQVMTAFGPVSNSYLYSFIGNPHYLAIDNSVTAGAVTGCLFQCQTSATGDCVFPPTISTGTPTLSVTNCIVLPNDASGATQGTSGKLVSDLQTAKVAVTAEHNTYCAAGGGDLNSAVVGLGETSGGLYAGCIASCRANLVWANAAAGRVWAAGDQTSTVADNVTVAGYNGFWNPSTGTCTYNTSTSQANVVGYGGIKVSNVNPFPNSQVGTGDLSANPGFVDSTRCLGQWGQRVHGVSAGSDYGVSETLAWIVAAGQANQAANIAAMMAWVRAGFAPTSAAYRAASYPGDASAADAAGNAWPGGAPGIGAMAYQAANAAGGASLLPAARAEPPRPPGPVVIRTRPAGRTHRHRRAG